MWELPGAKPLSIGNIIQPKQQALKALHQPHFCQCSSCEGLKKDFGGMFPYTPAIQNKIQLLVLVWREMWSPSCSNDGTDTAAWYIQMLTTGLLRKLNGTVVETIGQYESEWKCLVRDAVFELCNNIPQENIATLIQGVPDQDWVLHKAYKWPTRY